MKFLGIFRSILIISAIGYITTFASSAVFTDLFEIDENYFSSGTVDISADPAQTAISMENMKPGDSVSSPITVVNSGSLDFSYDVSAKKDAGISDFYNVLTAKIEGEGGVLYEGPLIELLNLASGRRILLSGESEDLTLTISLPEDVDSSLDEKYVKIAFLFSAEQL